MAALAYDSARQRDTLREQVRRDGLTGLLNHRACHERLREALADGGPVAVVLLDLDHFKVINDAHGHAEGDRVLAATAERLRSVVRAGDTVGRLGGEEFVLILPGADVEAAEDCAERARAALAELTVRGRPLAASAGVAAAPADGVDAAVLLENADAALYWAKRTGRGRTVRYVRGAVRPGGRAAQRGRGAARARAVGAISIVFQPVVELATGRAGGYEALARFEREPRRGPDEWFAQAHRVGLGEELEALALRAALAVPGRPEGTFLALNVSPRALLSAPVRAALPARSHRDRDRAHRARGVRRRGRRSRRSWPRCAPAARRSRSTTPAPATRACSRSSGSRPTSSSSTARWSTARTPTARARRCSRR